MSVLNKGTSKTMAFCKFSSEVIRSNSTSVENTFINEFLPNASGDAIRVYLYGLYKCSTGAESTLAEFSQKLNLSEQDILSIYIYWQSLGLVQVFETNPFEVRYLPVKNGASSLRKFDVNKYKSFNMQAQEIISGREILPNEFHEYYLLMESMHMKEDALLMIINYCVSKKDNKINMNYILTVAKNWAYEGYLTADLVEQHFAELEAFNQNLVDIIKTLGSKAKPSIDNYQTYLTWVNNYGFDFDTLLHLAKLTKTKKGNFEKLNATVQKCYELNLRSIKEIDDYFMQLTNNLNLAKAICRNLGVYYDNVNVVVDEYIINWLNHGYDEATLKTISIYCFKAGIRTLEGLNQKIEQFFKLGIITNQSLENYLAQLSTKDANIKQILEQLGIVRMVNQFDRNNYNTWINDWKISDELLAYAISVASNKIQPMQFLNRLLSIYHEKNIDTVEKAKVEKTNFVVSEAPPKTSNKTPKQHNYTKAELNSMFSSLTEVDL